MGPGFRIFDILVIFWRCFSVLNIFITGVTLNITSVKTPITITAEIHYEIIIMI